MKLYAVQNKEGKWLHDDYDGAKWVHTIEKARMYTSLISARFGIKGCVKQHPEYSTLEVVVFDIAQSAVLKEKIESTMSKDREEKEDTLKELKKVKAELLHAQQRLKKLEATGAQRPDMFELLGPMSQEALPQDELVRVMFGVNYAHEIAKQLCSVQPMHGSTLGPLLKFFADGGAIVMSCDSLVGKQETKDD